MQVPCGLSAAFQAMSLASGNKRQPHILTSLGLDPFQPTGMIFLHGVNDMCRKGLAEVTNRSNQKAYDLPWHCLQN